MNGFRIIAMIGFTSAGLCLAGCQQSLPSQTAPAPMPDLIEPNLTEDNSEGANPVPSVRRKPNLGRLANPKPKS